MTTGDIEKQVRTYILENFVMGDDESALSSSASFLDTGLIDSTGVLELITFIEDTYDILLDDDDMIPENLDSIDNLVGFIKRKTQ